MATVVRSQRVRRVLQALSLLSGLGALAVLLAIFGTGGLAAAFAQIRPLHLGAYLALACAVRLGFSLRWFLVARSLGQTPPFSRFLAARLAGDAVGALVSTGSVGGDPMRIALLYGRGVGGAQASAGVALDRVMELIGNLICCVVYVTVFVSSQALAPARRSAWGLAILFPSLLAALLVVPLVLLRRGVRPLSPMVPARWLPGRPRLSRFVDLVRRIENDLMGALEKRPSLIAAGILGTLLLEALVVLEYRFLLGAFGLKVEVPTLLLMLVTVGLVRTIPVPAGLGALEWSQVTLLQAVKSRADLGFIVGMVMRLHETLWLAVGLLALSLQGFSIARLGVASGPERASSGRAA